MEAMLVVVGTTAIVAWAGLWLAVGVTMVVAR